MFYRLSTIEKVILMHSSCIAGYIDYIVIIIVLHVCMAHKIATYLAIRYDDWLTYSYSVHLTACQMLHAYIYAKTNQLRAIGVQHAIMHG